MTNAIVGARKRTAEQRENDLRRIMELRLQKHTDNEIRAILFEETGIQLSRSQIQYDRTSVRKMWLSETIDTYAILIREELGRIDALETSIWTAMRESAAPGTKEIVTKARRKMADAEEGDDYEMVKIKEISVLESNGIPPAFFTQIQECQKERRRLLGLYAPQQIDVQKTIALKGYRGISPDDWDRAIEGEVVEVIK